MALLQKSLEEPLLSRQQSSVCRDILRAAQLNEALRSLALITQTLSHNPDKGDEQIVSATMIRNYLESEIKRVLNEIKTPKIITESEAKDTSTDSGKALKVSPSK